MRKAVQVARCGAMHTVIFVTGLSVGIGCQADSTLSTTTLGPSANPIAVGKSLTLVANIVGARPTCSVRCNQGSTSLRSPVALVSGQASCSLTPFTAAAHPYSDHL